MYVSELFWGVASGLGFGAAAVSSHDDFSPGIIGFRTAFRGEG